MPFMPSSQSALAQHRLSDFLYTELLHTLGAYQVAGEKLGELEKDLRSTNETQPLLDAVAQAAHHNGCLCVHLHTSEPKRDRRHPSPLMNPADLPDRNLLVPVQAFYETSAEALELHLAAGEKKWDERSDGEKLGMRLARIHDPQRRGPTGFDEELVKGRLERTSHRLELARKVYEAEPCSETELPEDKRDPIEAILGDHLGENVESSKPKPLHITILEAFSDAHKWMHQAEHLRSQTFEAMFTEIPDTHARMEAMLKRSLVLNTFVYVAARSVPWVFADDERERLQVVENFDECCESLTPTYCMWIGNQLGLLALERRAYTWWTLGRRDRAYYDFYKLTRLLRGLRRQVGQRAMRAPGTRTLVEGLTATAEHHIGRIYRGQHAHRVALRYFDRASNHLKGWEDHPEIGHILRNSRWRVNLLISRGKANYELGRIKTSLLYYTRAWRAFLQLAESESHASANLELVDGVIKWLESVEGDPELSKLELSERIEPIVGQFETVYSPSHLRLLAADIMMRLGHLLGILKLPPLDWRPEDDPGGDPEPPDHELARRCMFQAAALDPASTLIATDLLKIKHGVRQAKLEEAKKKAEKDGNGERPKIEETEYPEMELFPDQWPAGGGRFEEAVRVIEYVVQTWLDHSADDADLDESQLSDNVEIARGLLRSFLAHTDSSNVKLAQVYRYLMQGPRDADRDPANSEPTIELVCLRRYSSFFPFLPRPAAFPALGGGYLVQVRDDANAKVSPFGIAIDPGPNFLDNLYRCGYSLADIHMLVLTHDHADHIASLDALLALLGIRQMLGAKTFSAEKRLTIVGNKSVVERYDFFNDPHPVKEKLNKKGEMKKAARPDVVRVMSFKKFHELTDKDDTKLRDRAMKKAKILPVPDSLRIEPVKTVDHLDARGYTAQGFLLSIGKGASESSVLFTSDTGAPPLVGPGRPDGGPHFACGTKSLEEATAEADVVVAHLSSVPLPELRKLSGLPPQDEERTRTFEMLWRAVAKQTGADDAGEPEDVDEAEFLLRQLQFAFRSRGRNLEDLEVSPFSDLEDMKPQPEKHLYLTGLLEIANRMKEPRDPDKGAPLLLIGELREELGTFRTRIASHITKTVFSDSGVALTADIGLRVRVNRHEAAEKEPPSVSVLCTTCDLDNDLIAAERFHPPKKIREVCVKGENEGVFYNCKLHDPGSQPSRLWVESVERYDVFGDDVLA
jgi:tetratricopeptide (TPR) repeat protein